MRLIDQIKSSNAWFQVMKEFETLSPEDYSINRAGTCKKMVSSLTSEIGPALLIPAHPKGSDNQNAWHSYAVIKSESGKPEDDVIVDLTAGQIIPDIPPFVGTRLGRVDNWVLAACKRQFCCAPLLMYAQYTALRCSQNHHFRLPKTQLSTRPRAS